MTTQDTKVEIRCLATGVPGLEDVLGGGVPEFSMNLIVGPPGAGKTTLCHQMMFALTRGGQRALYFTVLGEAPLKMLRYQQQFRFFTPEAINDSIRFVDLGKDVAAGDYARILMRIRREVESFSPGLVFVDSFRTIMMEAGDAAAGSLSPQMFIQQLGVYLSGWQVTSFLVGEFHGDADIHPIFTVADGLIAMTQSLHRNSMVRKIQILKMRGQPSSPGLHTFRITGDGIEVYPSAVVPGDSCTVGPVKPGTTAPPRSRLSLGVPFLDEMLGGGLPAGYSLLVAGPSGSGKTVLSTAFLSEGARLGETGIIVAFEQPPSQCWTPTIHDLVQAGRIGLINTRLLDLSIDEVVQRLVSLIRKLKATRVVIDSLSGFELAVAPSFREDFRESLFRMVSVLSALGVTVLMTSELEDRFTDLRFSSYGSAFLTDAIIVQRYIEIRSRLERILAVVKVRGSAHSSELRRYVITDEGICIGDPVKEYEGLLGGRPTTVPPL